MESWQREAASFFTMCAAMRLEPFKATQRIQTALPPFLHSKGFDVQGPPNVLKSA